MRKFALATALVFAGAGAFAQDVKTDFDKDANFAAIKTFAVKIGTSWNNQISEKRVTDEIAQTLSEKGWKQVDANPDALVLLHGATEKQKSLNTFYSGGGYGGYGYRGWGGMGGMGTATTTAPSTWSARWSWTSSTRSRRRSCSAARRRTRSRTSRRRTSRRSRRPATRCSRISPRARRTRSSPGRTIQPAWMEGAPQVARGGVPSFFWSASAPISGYLERKSGVNPAAATVTYPAVTSLQPLYRSPSKGAHE